MEKIEIWKTIKDYPDYEISNFGRIKTLKFSGCKMLNYRIGTDGYFKVDFFNQKRKTFKVHQLVCMAFKNHIPCGHKLVINHIDFNKLNNSEDNLEIITNRENSNKRHLCSSSEYTGVSWNKRLNKWSAQITLDKKQKHLGYFEIEYDAHVAYQNKLNSIL